jgi:hypothetical protein
MSDKKLKRISAALKLALVLLVGGTLYGLNYGLNYVPDTTPPDLHTATVNAIKAANALKTFGGQ